MLRVLLKSFKIFFNCTNASLVYYGKFLAIFFWIEVIYFFNLKLKSNSFPLETVERKIMIRLKCENLLSSKE